MICFALHLTLPDYWLKMRSVSSFSPHEEPKTLSPPLGVHTWEQAKLNGWLYSFVCGWQANDWYCS
jgi:hypothetical protein